MNKSIIIYVASEKPKEFAELIRRYGVNTTGMTTQKLVDTAVAICQKNAEKFYTELYAIHPDREIFEDEFESNHPIMPATNSTCIFDKLPEPIKTFYSGEYKTLKIIGTIALAVLLIRKL